MDSKGALLFSNRKLVSLDGIRGLAILAVMICHVEASIPAIGGIQPALNWICRLGWAGVDLFFVLSGFLITGILLDSRDAGNYFSSFYARRTLRIFPLAYAFLVFAFAVFPYTVRPDWMPLPADRWLYFCYLTNWLVLWKGRWGANIVGHFWSLAVEEQFYVAWPLAVRLLRSGILLPALLASEGLVFVGRWLWVAGHGPSQAVAVATVTRMDGLLLGAACAILVRRYRIPQRFVTAMPMVWAGGLLIFLAGAIVYRKHGDFYFQTLGFPILAFAFAVLLLHAVLTEETGGWLRSILCWRRLTNVGKYAYGIYVYHVPVFYFGGALALKFVRESVRETSIPYGYAFAGTLFIAVYCVAKLSYVFFERYFLNFKDRFAAIPLKSSTNGPWTSVWGFGPERESLVPNETVDRPEEGQQSAGDVRG